MSRVLKNVVPAIVLLMLLASTLAPIASSIYFGKRITMDIGDNNLTEGGATGIIIAVKDSDGNPVDLLTVHIDATSGTLDEDSRVTNIVGQVAFTYFAPTAVSGTLDDTITASTTMGDGDFETSGVIRVTSRLTVVVDGPLLLQTGGEAETYDISVDSGGEPVSGATVTVDKAGPGTLDEVGGATDVGGQSWFTFTPPSGTGETTFWVNATHISHGTASTTFRVLIMEDLAPLVVSVEADRGPLPSWGSCNVTATVSRSGNPVEGAYVSWEVSKGWLERDAGNTDASGHLSVVYTAMGDEPGLWAGDVTVTANTTDGFEWAEAEKIIQIAPYAAVFTPKIKMDATGGQLFDGERFEVDVSIALEEGAPWEFITPFDVYLVWMNALGEEMERRLLGEDLTVDGPFTWSSRWHYVFTADEGTGVEGFLFDVLVLSTNGHHVYEQIDEPFDVSILSGLEDEWTFLVHLNGDNDLTFYSDYFLDWLESAAPENGEFTVYVQYDRSYSGSGYANWMDTKRFQLTRNEVNEEIDSQLVEVVGEVDSGSASTVYDFMMWGSQRSPAGHYCLLMWDHGGAYAGSSWDTTSDTLMANSDLAEALDMFKTHRRKLDVLVFDMCLMSSIGVFNQFKDVANYMAASETSINTDFTVPEFLQGIEEYWPDARPSPLHVVTQVLNGYWEHVEEWGGDMFPFAAADLGKTDALLVNLDTLADALLGEWVIAEALVWDARSDSQRIEGPYASRRWLVDAEQFFSNLRDCLVGHPLSGQLQDAISASEDVLSSLEDLVFYHLPVEDLQGASIFFPGVKASYENQRDTYIANGLPEDTGWTRLLDAFFLGLPGEEGGDPPFWPIEVHGFLEGPLQDVVGTANDIDGDGQAEGVDLPFNVDNINNLNPVTVVFDLVVHNGSRAGTIDGLVDRRVISVPAGEHLQGTVTLTSPVVDLADVIVSVIAGDGTVLQEPYVGSYTMNATPRDGTPPTLELSALPVLVTEGEEVTLTATVDDPEEDEVTVWWDVDDGDGVGIDVTGTTATSTYRGVGNRSAVCIATDGHWFVVRRVDVTVLADVDNRQPVADLTATALDPAENCEEFALLTGHDPADTLTMTFDASGSDDPDGDPMEYAIDFGDGRWTSWQGDPTFDHTYAEAGTYRAILRVRDHTRFDGSYSVLSVDVEAVVPNAPPVARLEVVADPAAPFLNFTVNASLSTDPDGDVLEYRFDWGDGEVTQWSNDPVATHLYLTVGDQTVTVEVRDPLGHIASASRDIEHEWVNKVPVPVLALEVDKVQVGQTVTVNASLSTDPDNGDTLAFRFDWGDGDSTGWSPTPVATHVYDEPGEYIITLTVRDDNGGEKDLTSTVQVKSKDDGDDGGSIPYPGVAFALTALIVVGLLMLMSPDRRRGS